MVSIWRTVIICIVIYLDHRALRCIICHRLIQIFVRTAYDDLCINSWHFRVHGTVFREFRGENVFILEPSVWLFIDNFILRPQITEQRECNVKWRDDGENGNWNRGQCGERAQRIFVIDRCISLVQRNQFHFSGIYILNAKIVIGCVRLGEARCTSMSSCFQVGCLAMTFSTAALVTDGSEANVTFKFQTTLLMQPIAAKLQRFIFSLAFVSFSHIRPRHREICWELNIRMLLRDDVCVCVFVSFWRNHECQSAFIQYDISISPQSESEHSWVHCAIGILHERQAKPQRISSNQGKQSTIKVR